MKKCGLLLLTVYFEFIFSEPVPRNLSQCDSAKSIYSQAGFATDDIFSIEQSGSFFFLHFILVSYSRIVFTIFETSAGKANYETTSEKFHSFFSNSKRFRIYLQTGKSTSIVLISRIKKNYLILVRIQQRLDTQALCDEDLVKLLNRTQSQPKFFT